MTKKFIVSLILLIASAITYVIGLTQEIVPMKDISTEVIGASLVAVIIFLTNEI